MKFAIMFIIVYDFNTIDGYIDIDEENVTEKQIEEAVYFQLGMGCLSNDNLVGELEWDYADIEIDM